MEDFIAGAVTLATGVFLGAIVVSLGLRAKIDSNLVDEEKERRKRVEVSDQPE